MVTVKFILWFFVGLLCVVNVWLLIMNVEYLFCAFIRHQPPYVVSHKRLRRAVVKELQKNYPNARRVCEIGAGYGTLARQISKDAGRDVLALENMPFSALVCWVRGFIWPGRYKTKWCDAIDFLKNTDQHFDAAVAYLGPMFISRLMDCAGRFDVLLSLDFELPGMRATRVIDGIGGYTIYNRKKYPHRVYIYEFKNKKQREKK